jgi:hypothetical protein
MFAEEKCAGEPHERTQKKEKRRRGRREEDEKRKIKTI